MFFCACAGWILFMYAFAALRATVKERDSARAARRAVQTSLNTALGSNDIQKAQLKSAVDNALRLSDLYEKADKDAAAMQEAVNSKNNRIDELVEAAGTIEKEVLRLREQLRKHKDARNEYQSHVNAHNARVRKFVEEKTPPVPDSVFRTPFRNRTFEDTHVLSQYLRAVEVFNAHVVYFDKDATVNVVDSPPIHISRGF